MLVRYKFGALQTSFCKKKFAFRNTIILVRQNAKNFFIEIWCGECTFLVRWSLFLVRHNHTPIADPNLKNLVYPMKKKFVFFFKNTEWNGNSNKDSEI
jgi:hypothetical protein